MKKFLILFMLVTIVFVTNVDAANYNFSWFKYLGVDGRAEEVTDILEIDSGYLMLSPDTKEILIYDKEGNQVDSKEINFKAKRIFTIDDKNYVVSDVENKIINIAVLNSDGTISDSKQIETNGNFDVNDELLLIRNNNIYFFNPYYYLKITSDFSSAEVFDYEIDRNIDTERNIISDVLYAAEQGDLAGFYDDGILVYDNEGNLQYLKNNKSEWSLKLVGIERGGGYAIEYKEKILLSTSLTIGSDLKKVIMVINKNGEIEEEIDLTEYLSERLGDYNRYDSFVLHSTDGGFFVADSYNTWDDEVPINQQNLRGEEGHNHYFLMYIEEIEVKNNNNQKVPETYDNGIIIYLLLMLLSFVSLLSIRYRKENL